MSEFRRVTLYCAQDVIATEMLRDRPPVAEALGSVTLRPGQRDAATRLRALITWHGGAMLAEPVGLGKTYTALAVAKCYEKILIAAPATLIGMWTEALRACSVTATLVTHEALSRRVSPNGRFDIILVDEAHRLRSANTRRYATLAALASDTPILLVTATPLQNRRADLTTQLALFLGRRAWELDDIGSAEFIVRESSSNPPGQPKLSGPHAISLATVDDGIDDILDLPPPVPAKDESLAIALATYGLVHQWSSSRAALIAALERRRARAVALRAVLDSGRIPTRDELAAWTVDRDAVQLAFTELIVPQSPELDLSPRELTQALDRHDDALDDLLDKMKRGVDPDLERANVLRRIREQHPHERIIAFCHYAETVAVLRSHLSRDAGIATLTASGARIAGGRVDRDWVLRQFMPRATGAQSTPVTEYISLLITTDLLSEGLNLQETSVIVHLDLPWNPARLEQRVGRARRLGSRHETVTVYSLLPPASAERMLQINARLESKLRLASTAIGTPDSAIPTVSASIDARELGMAETVGAVETIIRGWKRAENFERPARGTVVACAAAELAGYLALVKSRGHARLVANVGDGVRDDPRSVLHTIRALRADAIAPSTDEQILIAFEELKAWLATDRGAASIGADGATDTTRRAGLARVARALASVPRARRTMCAPLAARARTAFTMPLTAGAECTLDDLVRSSLPDQEWLAALAEFGTRHARAPAPDADHSAMSISAVILMRTC